MCALEPVYSRATLAVLDALGFDYFRSADSYRRALRANGRGLWVGVTDLSTFAAGMEATVSRGLRQAFADGLAKEGLREDEMTQAELAERDTRILAELQHVPNLGRWIADHNQESGTAWKTITQRLELWVSRYSEMVYTGQLVAARDKKMEWRWDPLKEHCGDCEKMNGRVYKASVWLRYGILPQSAHLECFGTFCGCGLYPTDKPLNKGRPPALKGPR